MAREYGREFPERPLMSTLSDLLGIEHFSTSRGSTVRSDFLVAVAAAMDVDEPTSYAKDDLIKVIWTAANGRPMPADRLSPGATVTNRVLQEIVDGLVQRGIPGRLHPSAPTPEDELPPEPERVFDPSQLGDTRDRRLAEVAQREGRDRFRQAVLSAYGGRCAITGSSEPMTLQACHIAPYRGREFNVVPNGVCLRADMHILFDRGAIAIHETSHKVLWKPHLLVNGYLGIVTGVTATVPRSARDRPSIAALRAHRLWAGFPDHE